MSTELKVPEVGESITEVLIVEWLKGEGDYAKRDEPVAVIETDKATLEVPSPISGTISAHKKNKGEWANVGDVIALLEEGEKPEQAEDGKEKKEKAKDAPEEKEKKTEKQQAEEEPEEKAAVATEEKEKPEEGAPEKRDGGKPAIMPAARRIIEQYNLDPKQIRGTGPDGRILKEDAQRHAEQKQKPEAEEEATEPEADKSPGGAPAGDRAEETVAMSPLRRSVARRLVEAQQNAALLTTFNEIDMSEVIALRREFGERFRERNDIKLGFMSFFVKAVVEALKQCPELNAEAREKEIVYRNYYDIGVAIGGGKGLVVPVIRNAERLSFAEIEKTIADFAARARENKIDLEELEGGTFTISNGGIYGSMLSTPIVNPPQSGILGLHAIQDRPVAREGEVVVRPMMYIALTYDHRIVDGREAVTFLRRVRDVVERPARMILEI